MPQYYGFVMLVNRASLPRRHILLVGRAKQSHIRKLRKITQTTNSKAYIDNDKKGYFFSRFYPRKSIIMASISQRLKICLIQYEM